MYLDRPNPVRLVLNELCRMNHNCSEGRKVIFGDRQHSETEVGGEVYQILVVTDQRNWTKQPRELTLLVQAVKNGVEDQQEVLSSQKQKSLLQLDSA